MDDADRLIEMFRSGTDMAVESKIDTLTYLQRLRDPRVVPFLLDVLADARQPAEVRVHVLKRVRDERLTDGFREPVARAILRILEEQDRSPLRLHAVLALAEFTDIEGVPATLGALALDSELPLDVRYSAFTSLERAGPTPECVAIIRKLRSDDALGTTARSLLLSWWIGFFM